MFQELSFFLTFSPAPISFWFFSCILKDKISGSGKLRSLILCPPDKSKAGLYYISGIGDHSVLWSLFACSQKCFDFVKGANNSCSLFPQSCFPVILQLFLTVGSKDEFQLACSSSACPLCRQSSVWILWWMWSVWHGTYAFWAYDGLVSQLMMWLGTEGRDGNGLSLKVCIES